VNFQKAGGSPYALAKELGVTYPGLNRRLTTAGLASTHKPTRPKFDSSVYEAAAKRVRKAQAKSPRAFHAQLYVEYVENELSLDKLGREYLSLSGAASLYYGVNREKLRRAGEID
jgi:hypothetical protein